MDQLIRFVADSLADFPEKVQIEMEESEGDLTYTLLVEQKDLGRVIGRHGKTAEAIRTLLSTKSHQEDRRVFLRIRELD
ncbi:MAG: KH domain-containing protein [Candidatus Krumholzibacteria bacterium]|jgi:hypothetical protein|nr:KH domain-containing protein [Candidatus Krumholzibacteria bacterium]MDP6669879.1 KH domain-containing protein [Candidatus Krumholzibacteria bacterium]MDP6796813.1 KH domain-containing protein [Candidatus Krumholzibacteria bacterium]MDP7021063.1 KH domain-containing protein [Candidatus Krumholzibacteria bacterium]